MNETPPQSPGRDALVSGSQQPPASAKARGGIGLHAGRLFFLLMLAIVLLSVLSPRAGISWARHHWAWFNRSMLWIELVNLPFNVIHAILFLALGFAVGLMFRAVKIWQTAVCFVIFSAATEIVQTMIPGRVPRLGDFTVDVFAGCVGIGLAELVVRARVRFDKPAGVCRRR